MGEMTDDDVALSGERFHRPDIRTKVGGQPFFGQARLCPVIPGETPFEVTTADEEQPSVDPGVVKSAAVELGNGTRAGPLVGEDDHADLHR